MSKIETSAVEVWRIERDDMTGSFVGFATLATSRIAVLHPVAARLAMRLLPAAESEVQLRLRCSVDNGSHVRVVDGTVVASGPSIVGRPLAIDLDFSTGILVRDDSFPWPSRPPQPEEADAIKDYLDHQSANDPVAPVGEPPGPADLGIPEEPTQPGIRPPWCSVWPGCWGC